MYDIQEPIYNYLEDNILQIFPRFMENITPSVQKHLYIYNEVSAHASTNDSIQTNTETLINLCTCGLSPHGIAATTGVDVGAKASMVVWATASVGGG